MLFVIEGKDRPGALETRMNNRPAHLEYLKNLGAKLKVAGPFLDGNDKPCGSMVIIEADDLEAAKAIAALDPYVGADLFETSSVRPWVWAINKPENI